MGKGVAIPWWKKSLSYFKEIILEESSSMHNPSLYVILHQGRFQLCTEEAIYSYDDKYDNFKIIFDKINFNKLPGNRILVLGLGLASIPYMLEHNFKKDFNYTGVEIDEEIVYLCSKYTMPRLSSNIEIMTIDAISYLLSTEQKFDMICLDVFDSEVIPTEILSTDFLNLCKLRLAQNGLLLMNHLNHTQQDYIDHTRYFAKVFEPSFPSAGSIPVKGNVILVNDLGYIH